MAETRWWDVFASFRRVRVFTEVRSTLLDGFRAARELSERASMASRAG
jgi:hypothetical protein